MQPNWAKLCIKSKHKILFEWMHASFHRLHTAFKQPSACKLLLCSNFKYSKYEKKKPSKLSVEPIRVKGTIFKVHSVHYKFMK